MKVDFCDFVFQELDDPSLTKKKILRDRVLGRKIEGEKRPSISIVFVSISFSYKIVVYEFVSEMYSVFDVLELYFFFWKFCGFSPSFVSDA